MLSDEEKKALERIDYIQDFIIENGQYNADVYDMEYFSRITNLIEKQSEEIEELKTINQMQKYRIEVIDERELISKDTIKEILGIEENIDNEKLLSLLQTIVDENARLEDIEDRKVQIEYNNVFNKGVKSVEDKIKAKIEEVDIQLQKLKDGLTGRKTNFVNKNMLFAQKKALQSFLEKE